MLGCAGPARAASLAFRGELTFGLPSLGVFAVVDGSGIAQVNGSGTGGALTSLALSPGVFAASSDYPGTPPIGGVRVSAQNAAGIFTGITPSGGGGAMPLLGAAQLCFGGSCGAAGLVLTLPLSVVGAGGTATVTGPFSVKLQGARWTKGPITLSAPGAISYITGFGAGPAQLAGSTAQPGGQLLLVTPARIQTNLPGFAEIPAFGLLHIEFVPEPRAAVLAALGLLAVAAAVRRSAG